MLSRESKPVKATECPNSESMSLRKWGLCQKKQRKTFDNCLAENLVDISCSSLTTHLVNEIVAQLVGWDLAAFPWAPPSLPSPSSTCPSLGFQGQPRKSRLRAACRHRADKAPSLVLAHVLSILASGHASPKKVVPSCVYKILLWINPTVAKVNGVPGWTFVFTLTVHN